MATFLQSGKVTITEGDRPSGRTEHMLNLDGALADTAAQARTSASSLLDATLDGMPLREYSAEWVAVRKWRVVADYGTAIAANGGVDAEVGNIRKTWQITNQTARVLRGFEEVSKREKSDGQAPPAALRTPAFDKQIGVNADGTVEGVDIRTPIEFYSETHYVAFSTVTTLYVDTIRSLASTVNNAVFKGLNAGEVLFLGANIDLVREDLYEIRYEFEIRRNTTLDESAFLPSSPAVSVRGHDVVWYYVAPLEDPTIEDETPQAIAEVVTRVYPLANLAGLGI
ncbi:MAG: hypothetical protein AAGI17_01890 [Planctomycetota bacterium]